MLHRPNIVMVLTDDQGYGDLGCHGNTIVETPSLDRFHDESIRFTNFHAGPTCAPTRASLFTGHYANSTGVWHTIGGRSLLREHEWTLASALGANGYRTGLFGKWHLGDAYPYRPQDRGFDKTVVHGGGGISQAWDHWGNDYFDDVYLVNGQAQQFEGYCTDVWFDQAINFIRDSHERPFFCCITANAPHWPYNVAPEYSRRYENMVPPERARFYGMISNIDENFARLRNTLKAMKLEDNTILIFMTDNGTSCGAELDKNGFVVDGYNAGMRGRKCWPHEGGHRVPFFVRWPSGNLDCGREIAELTSVIDFMPTILDLCGVEVPAEREFHGISLLPLIRGDDWAARTIVTDSQRVANPIKWRQSAVMTDRWRLINGHELYDMTCDPGQRNNVAEKHPEIVLELRDDYEKWWQIVSQQFEEEIPTVIGDACAMKTELRGHDWRNEDCSCPWHQGHIRQGMQANGYWEIDVRQAGVYRVELRRWPKESDRAIEQGIDGDDVDWEKEAVLPDCWSLYRQGVSLPITCAKLEINGQVYQQAVDAGQTVVVFDIELKKGRQHLTSWFLGDNGLQLGAYYVDIEMMG